jgi:hypothetical protein
VQFTQSFEVVPDVTSRFMTRELGGHDCSYHKHSYCRIWQYMTTKRDVDVHHAAGKNVFGCPCIPDIPEWCNLQPCVTCAALCHHSHYKIMPHSSLQFLLKDFFIKYSNQLVLRVYVLWSGCMFWQSLHFQVDWIWFAWSLKWMGRTKCISYGEVGGNLFNQSFARVGRC